MLAGSVLQSPHLGEIEWDAGSELFLPQGLPGFENERRMIPVEIPAQRPLVFLQSLDKPDTCFVALPAGAVCPDYRLHLSDDDRHALELETGREPAVGEDVLCLALLMPSGETVQVNLNAPIVINLHNSRCVQALSTDATARSYRLTDHGTWETLC